MTASDGFSIGGLIKRVPRWRSRIGLVMRQCPRPRARMGRTSLRGPVRIPLDHFGETAVGGELGPADDNVLPRFSLCFRLSLRDLRSLDYRTVRSRRSLIDPRWWRRSG